MDEKEYYYTKEMLEENKKLVLEFMKNSRFSPEATKEDKIRAFFNRYNYFDTDKPGIFKKSGVTTSGGINIKVENFGDTFHDMKLDGKLLFEHLTLEFNPVFTFYFLKQYIEKIEKQWTDMSDSQKIEYIKKIEDEEKKMKEEEKKRGDEELNERKKELDSKEKQIFFLKSNGVHENGENFKDVIKNKTGLLRSLLIFCYKEAIDVVKDGRKRRRSKSRKRSKTRKTRKSRKRSKTSKTRKTRKSRKRSF
jgi:hypothetical protein